MEIDTGLRRWEIGADQHCYTLEVGDRCRHYTESPISAAATSINTDRLLSYLGLGLCWESNREMLTEGEENEMKRVEGGR